MSQNWSSTVNRRLSTSNEADLLIFDDGMHSALELWEFCIRLVKTESVARRLDFVFVEVLSISGQPHIDAFMDAETTRTDLLAPALQNDFSTLTELTPQLTRT